MAWIGDFAVVAVPHTARRLHLQLPGVAGTRRARLAAPAWADHRPAPPRIPEKMLTQLRVRAANVTPLKRRAVRIFPRPCRAGGALCGRGQTGAAPDAGELGAGKFLAHAPVRDQLGLRRARWVYTGARREASTPSASSARSGWQHSTGWGSTELSGLASLQPDGEVDPARRPRPPPGSEVRIAEDGEVLTAWPACSRRSQAARGDGRGVWRRRLVPHRRFRICRWARPLVIIDRAKDVGKLGDGTPFAPQFVENKLKFSPFIAEAVALAIGGPSSRR